MFVFNFEVEEDVSNFFNELNFSLRDITGKKTYFDKSVEKVEEHWERLGSNLCCRLIQDELNITSISSFFSTNCVRRISHASLRYYKSRGYDIIKYKRGWLSNMIMGETEIQLI